MRTNYVDLSRQFLIPSRDGSIERWAEESYRLPGATEPRSWADLLAHGRAVVLGEAGSGKTWELEAEAERQARDRPSFFVRLEQLDQGLRAALGPGEAAACQSWRQGRGEAAFFLDAVDEARLSNHHAFEARLTALAHELGDAMPRAHIVLSCRISEWRPIADPELVTRLLPGGANDPAVLVVHLNPLTEEQIGRLAAERLGDAAPFLRAVAERHAWDLARRPKDVEDLITYWREHRRLGARHELLEADVRRKLREINDRRLTLDPLPDDKARQGAEALAAAVVLCRRFAFPVPGAPTDDTLDPQAVLGGWMAGEVQALLGRALFDEAAYGKVRFHHRETIDYLAACWMRRLPAETVATIVFRDGHGRTVIPPTVAPVAAWLADWDAGLRARVLAVDADVLLRHGDPSLLPPRERRKLLEWIAQRHRVRMLEDRPQLRRLACPQIAGKINDLLRSPQVAEDVKDMLLLTIREGRLSDCADTALAIAIDPRQEGLRQHAIGALAAIDDRDRLARLAMAVTTGPGINDELCRTLLIALYPETLDERGLGELLARTAGSSSFNHLPHQLADIVDKDLPQERLQPLLTVLIDLSRREPCLVVKDETRPSDVSQRLSWVREPMLKAVLRVRGKCPPQRSRPVFLRKPSNGWFCLSGSKCRKHQRMISRRHCVIMRRFAKPCSGGGSSAFANGSPDGTVSCGWKHPISAG